MVMTSCQGGGGDVDNKDGGGDDKKQFAALSKDLLHQGGKTGAINNSWRTTDIFRQDEPSLLRVE